MPKIEFLNNEEEIAASITYPDNSKTELSFLKETKMLSLSHYEDASFDIPDKEYHLKLPEVQALIKLFTSPEVSQLLEVA